MAPSVRFVKISSLPAIYWLWESKRGNLVCSLFVWPFVPCQNLLDNPGNDCESSASTQDPDTIYPGDGPNCLIVHQQSWRAYDGVDQLLDGPLDAQLVVRLAGADDPVGAGDHQ